MKPIEFKETGASCCTPKGAGGAETKPAASVVQADAPVQQHAHLPVAIIGAGPIGLAAAAQLAERGQSFVLFEAGDAVGHHIRQWGHVQLFSTWQYNVDQAAARLLRQHGWEAPKSDELPLGRELVEQYLEPLAQVPPLKPHIRLNTKVVSLSRRGTDKMKSAGREAFPFVLYVEQDGVTSRVEARAVIDASGTWGQPNPLQADGVWTREERSWADQVTYGIPDISGEQKSRYAGKRVAVIGSGHSAINTLLDLATLKAEVPATELIWILRKRTVEEAYGGEGDDQLEARGALGSRIHQLMDADQITAVTPFRVEQVSGQGGKLQLLGTGAAGTMVIDRLDEIIVNTGSRPDYSFLSEIRLTIDPATESVEALAPLIDPNEHSCGTVRPHGERELRHGDPYFYTAGMKSYGRAPTFLMATGYEQVRSIAAYLAGDLEAAQKVELVLPETGVCSVPRASSDPEDACTASQPESGCCG
ncbi:FAD-dependent oxidoreductase [Paenibacillus sp. JSM ZJ436]|uniref:FAD-dependent oxidoreductase n=1 Tax=Paenibacillus sp. JSM ZJ436 TaxID=3376190 RepID=UPI0037B2FEC0